MELDRNYFNSIRLNTHRGKYYDVEAVDRLLVDIRSKADTLTKEVLSAREKLAEAERTAETLRDENADLFLKGQALSQEILSLREELRAAQAGETSLIPEEEPSTAVKAVSEEPTSKDESAWGDEEDFYFLTEELPEPARPEEDFEAESETVGGWTVEHFGEFPKTGDSFTYQNFDVSVLSMDGRRVEKVLVKLHEDY